MDNLKTQCGGAPKVYDTATLLWNRFRRGLLHGTQFFRGTLKEVTAW
jgi:hypothetical protein